MSPLKCRVKQMQADTEALMATNKKPENRLRPKLALLSNTLAKPGSSLTGSILVTHAKLAIYRLQNGTLKSSQFP